MPFASPNLPGLVHCWFEVGLVMVAAGIVVAAAILCLNPQHVA